MANEEKTGVLRAGGEYRLIALAPFAPDETLFPLAGDITTRPSRYSVQVGAGQHLDLLSPPGEQDILDHYFWRFMNHSCAPNVMIRARQVVALRAIAPYEAITFNYNTTEWDMDEPFACRCGAPQCLGLIRGYRHLTAGRRAALPAIADHLAGS